MLTHQALPSSFVCSISPGGELQQNTQQEQLFDAVVVANGHYHEPNLPEVPGMDAFPGLQLHSHNYRYPERFAGQVWMSCVVYLCS